MSKDIRPGDMVEISYKLVPGAGVYVHRHEYPSGGSYDALTSVRLDFIDRIKDAAAARGTRADQIFGVVIKSDDITFYGSSVRCYYVTVFEGGLNNSALVRVNPLAWNLKVISRK